MRIRLRDGALRHWEYGLNKQQYRDRLALMRCVVCNHSGYYSATGSIELHHVAEGSGLRSDWALVPLCQEHHRGSSGLHGMGTKAFIRLYRPPGDSEYGLLVWLLEDLNR